MPISFSTNKNGENALYINDYAQLVSTDTIHWLEVAIVATTDYVTLIGFLSPESLGVVNYKDKNWKPSEEKCTLKVHKSKRNQWDRDANKFVSVDVSREENYLFAQLTAQSSSHCQTLFGSIKPWVNPYFWELDLNDQNAVAIAERLTKEIVALYPHDKPTRLKQSDIEAVKSTNDTQKSKGNYIPPETESEKIAARYSFVKSEFSQLFEFASLYNLADQIEALHPDTGLKNDHQYRVATRITELIKLVIGN